MNKTQVIEHLTARLGDRKVAETGLDAFLDLITRQVAKGEKVSISGFGTFEGRERAARTARNPSTGGTVRMKKTVVPKFRLGTHLKVTTAGTVKLGREAKPTPLLPSGVTGSRAQALLAELGAAGSGNRATGGRRASTASKTTASKTAATKTAARKTAATKAAATSATGSTTAKATATKSTARKTTAAKTAATTSVRQGRKTPVSTLTSPEPTKRAPRKTTATRRTNAAAAGSAAPTKTATRRARTA